MRRDILKIENQMDQFMDKIVECESPVAAKAYERKIEQLEKERLIMVDRLENGFKLKASASQLLELYWDFLSNPCKLWDSGDIGLRKLVLRLTFLEPIPYCRKTGYRAPDHGAGRSPTA